MPGPMGLPGFNGTKVIFLFILSTLNDCQLTLNLSEKQNREIKVIVVMMDSLEAKEIKENEVHLVLI